MSSTKIIAIDEVPERLALAKELGATHTITHGSGTVAELKELTKDMLDFSVEATDGANLVAEAIEALGIRGTCAMVGGAKITETVKYNFADVLLKGKRIIGAMGGGGQSPMFLEDLIQLQLEGRVGPVLRTFVDDTLGIAIRHLSWSASTARDSS